MISDVESKKVEFIETELNGSFQGLRVEEYREGLVKRYKVSVM